MSIHTYIGFIGSGKTCAAACFATRAIRQGKTVYHNIPDLAIGTYVPETLIGIVQLYDCLYLLDEAGISFNNRLAFGKKQQKEAGVSVGGMTRKQIYFMKMSGHYKCDFIVFSQAQDFDVTIRRLSTRIFIIQKLLPWVSYTYRLAPKWETDPNTGDPRISWIKAPFSYRFIWLPRWWRLFDRFNPPVLAPLEPPYEAVAFE